MRPTKCFENISSPGLLDTFEKRKKTACLAFGVFRLCSRIQRKCMNEKQVEISVCLYRNLFQFSSPRREETKLLYFLLLKNCISTLHFDTDITLYMSEENSKEVKKEEREFQCIVLDLCPSPFSVMYYRIFQDSVHYL